MAFHRRHIRLVSRIPQRTIRVTIQVITVGPATIVRATVPVTTADRATARAIPQIIIIVNITTTRVLISPATILTHRHMDPLLAMVGLAATLTFITIIMVGQDQAVGLGS